MFARRVRFGPDPADSFIVLEGMVAVIGTGGSVTLPAGMVWPGQHALPDALMNRLQAVETQLSITARTAPWVASPRDLQVAEALVTVQLLRAGDAGVRLSLLSELTDLTAQVQETTAHLLGLTRESVSKRLARPRVID